MQQRHDHPLLRILGFVGDDADAWRVLEQNVSTFQIMDLSRCEVKPGRETCASTVV